jgi:hypothetical protein
MKRMLLLLAAASFAPMARGQDVLPRASEESAPLESRSNGGVRGASERDRGAASAPDGEGALPPATTAGAEYPSDEEESLTPRPSPPSEEQLRQELWNSDEMRDARTYVLQYSERLRGSSRSQGEQYLRRVAELPSAEMRRWLERLQQRRTFLEQQRRIAEQAQQWGIERALNQQYQSQQAGLNAQRARGWIIEVWQQQAADRAIVDAAKIQRRGERAAQLDGQRLVFDPFAPTLDPASPGAYERYAASASLPGDLPRGDPANFYVGDDRGGAAPPPGSDGAVGGSGVGPTGGAAATAGAEGGAGAAPQ